MPANRPRRVMPVLAMVAGAALVLIESLNGNAISFWSAVGVITCVLAGVELFRGSRNDH